MTLHSLRCCIASCITDAETVVLGLALCKSDLEVAWEYPEDDWTDLTPGRLYQWIDEVATAFETEEGVDTIPQARNFVLAKRKALR